MDFTITDVVYLAMAVRAMLEKELTPIDRQNYEKIWMKLKLSHKGKKIAETFNEPTKTYFDILNEARGQKGV